MKQTAVEFLYEALWEAGKDKFIWQIILQQAIEMENEQIEIAWKQGNLPTNLGRVLTFEEYYNETYGKK
jgi:hypothetical protein